MNLRTFLVFDHDTDFRETALLQEKVEAFCKELMEEYGGEAVYDTREKRKPSNGKLDAAKLKVAPQPAKQIWVSNPTRAKRAAQKA